jgi:hypothetical protein
MKTDCTDEKEPPEGESSGVAVVGKEGVEDG